MESRMKSLVDILVKRNRDSEDKRKKKDHGDENHEDENSYDEAQQNGSQQKIGRERESSRSLPNHSSKGNEGAKPCQVFKRRHTESASTGTGDPSGEFRNRRSNVALSSRECVTERGHAHALESHQRDLKPRGKGASVGHDFIVQQKRQFEHYRKCLSTSKTFVEEFDKNKKELEKYRKERYLSDERIGLLEKQLQILKEEYEHEDTQLEFVHVKAKRELDAYVEKMIHGYGEVLEQIRIGINYRSRDAVRIVPAEREDTVSENSPVLDFQSALDKYKKAAAKARIELECFLEGLFAHLERIEDNSQAAGRTRMEMDIFLKEVQARILQMEIASLKKALVSGCVPERKGLLKNADKSEDTQRSGDVHKSEPVLERKVLIKNVDMPEDMQQAAIKCANQALETFAVENDIAIYVKEEFDKTYSPTWHCIVGRHFGSYVVTYEDKHFVYFHLGHVAFLLFKSG